MQDDRLPLAPVVIDMLGTDVGRVDLLVYPMLQFWFAGPTHNIYVDWHVVVIEWNT